MIDKLPPKFECWHGEVINVLNRNDTEKDLVVVVSPGKQMKNTVLLHVTVKASDEAKLFQRVLQAGDYIGFFGCEDDTFELELGESPDPVKGVMLTQLFALFTSYWKIVPRIETSPERYFDSVQNWS